MKMIITKYKTNMKTMNTKNLLVYGLTGLLIACNSYEDEYQDALEEINKLENQIDSLRNQVKELQTQTANDLQKINELQATIAQDQTRIQALTTALSEQSLMTEELQKRLDDLQATLNAELAKIEDLETTIKTLSQQLANTEDAETIASLEAEIKELEEDLAEAQANVEEVEVEVEVIVTETNVVYVDCSVATTNVVAGNWSPVNAASNVATFTQSRMVTTTLSYDEGCDKDDEVTTETQSQVINNPAYVEADVCNEGHAFNGTSFNTLNGLASLPGAGYDDFDSFPATFSIVKTNSDCSTSTVIVTISKSEDTKYRSEGVEDYTYEGNTYSSYDEGDADDVNNDGDTYDLFSYIRTTYTWSADGFSDTTTSNNGEKVFIQDVLKPDTEATFVSGTDGLTFSSTVTGTTNGKEWMEVYFKLTKTSSDTFLPFGEIDIDVDSDVNNNASIYASNNSNVAILKIVFNNSIPVNDEIEVTVGDFVYADTNVIIGGTEISCGCDDDNDASLIYVKVTLGDDESWTNNNSDIKVKLNNESIQYFSVSQQSQSMNERWFIIDTLSDLYGTVEIDVTSVKE